jgi:lysozyme family protein
MKNNFNECLSRVLKDEGGYSNDPSDSGGATKYGITIGDVSKYVKKNATPDDVKALTVAQASTIYKARYWDALNCDTLPSGVDYTCFDYGVHSGLGRPRKALDKFKSLSGTYLIDAINNERTTFLQGLAATRTKDQKYLRGWLNRVERVRAYSKSIATKKDTSTGPVIATTTLGASLGLANYFHNHQTAIIIGGVAVALAIGFAVHYFMNRKTNV